jgi:GxxExxY protein
MDIEIDRITETIIGAAIEVHRELGPGLLESAYQCATAEEFRERGLDFREQELCPVRYKKLTIANAFRLDFIVCDKVVVELKTVDALIDPHVAQVLTYLRFTGCPVGLLINFRAPVLTKGLRRLAL